MPSRPGPFKTALCAIATLAVAACGGPAPTPQGIDDPLEDGNRRIHAFNKGVALAVLPDDGGGPTPAAERLLRQGAANFAGNLGGPSDVLNAVLQGRIENAGHNAFRFAINSSLGLAGLLDPARSFGLERRETDFGETLHVWGVGEGAYVELPFLGPSTVRDTGGDIVDTLINPLRHVAGPTGNKVITGANVAEEVADASEVSGVVGGILRDSADSYAQLRLGYLQSRRFELERNARIAAGDRAAPGAAAAAAPATDATNPYGDAPASAPAPAEDPFDTDPYATASAPVADDPYAAAPAPDDPYAAPAPAAPAAAPSTDPYEDPYAQ